MLLILSGIGLLFGGLGTAPAAGSIDPLSRAPTRQDEASALRQLWDSLNTLELTCEEFDLDAQGNRDPSRPFMTHEFRLKKPGRYTYDLRMIRPGGQREVMESLRGDGRVRTAIRSFPGSNGEIAALHMKNQESTDERYEDAKFSVLWLVMPGGRPLASYLESGATLTRAEKCGPTHYLLEARHGESPLRCILDASRDWLPIRVELESRRRKFFWEATRFAREGHRWFPVEGRFTAPTSEGTRLKGFAVPSFALNRLVDDGLFAAPDPPVGVEVVDEVSGKSFVKGGREAGVRRQATYAPPHTNAGGATATLLLAGAAWVKSRAT